MCQKSCCSYRFLELHQDAGPAAAAQSAGFVISSAACQDCFLVSCCCAESVRTSAFWGEDPSSTPLLLKVKHKLHLVKQKTWHKRWSWWSGYWNRNQPDPQFINSAMNKNIIKTSIFGLNPEFQIYRYLLTDNFNPKIESSTILHATQNAELFFLRRDAFNGDSPCVLSTWDLPIGAVHHEPRPC